MDHVTTGSTGATGGAWVWALVRLGSRVPLYGSSHKVVPPAKAGEWLHFLIEHGPKLDGSSFAVAQIARLTGDRSRYLDDRTRNVALDSSENQSLATWIQMVRQVVQLEAADEARLWATPCPLA